MIIKLCTSQISPNIENYYTQEMLKCLNVTFVLLKLFISVPSFYIKMYIWNKDFIDFLQQRLSVQYVVWEWPLTTIINLSSCSAITQPILSGQWWPSVIGLKPCLACLLSQPQLCCLIVITSRIQSATDRPNTFSTPNQLHFNTPTPRPGYLQPGKTPPLAWARILVPIQ